MSDYRPSIPRKEYDSLVAEVERLKCILELTTNLKQQAETEVERLEAIKADYEKELDGMRNLHKEQSVKMGELIQKNEQLREALKKCSPYTVYHGCSFCRYEHEHADNCEYVQLCGGKKEANTAEIR